MALDAALKLLVAVVRQPDRTIRKKHSRQCGVKHERRVVAAAEPAADIGELGVDLGRFECGLGLPPNRGAIESAAS